jgi:hypothetical protein
MFIATMSTTEVWTWLIVLACIGGACKAISDRRLLLKNPEAWRAKKAAEEDAKERKRNAAGKAVGGAFKIASMFLKK